MRKLTLALIFALIGPLATAPAEAVKHCACRPR